MRQTIIEGNFRHIYSIYWLWEGQLLHYYGSSLVNLQPDWFWMWTLCIFYFLIKSRYNFLFSICNFSTKIYYFNVQITSYSIILYLEFSLKNSIEIYIISKSWSCSTLFSNDWFNYLLMIWEPFSTVWIFSWLIDWNFSSCAFYFGYLDKYN